MRKIMIPTVLAAMGLAILNANAQTGPRPQSPSQSQPPAQSAQPSETTGRAVPQAPTGHRQPRATDVPDQGSTRMGPGELDIDRQLKICRNC
jgi:hypothetical protein